MIKAENALFTYLFAKMIDFSRFRGSFGCLYRGGTIMPPPREFRVSENKMVPNTKIVPPKNLFSGLNNL